MKRLAAILAAVWATSATAQTVNPPVIPPTAIAQMLLPLNNTWTGLNTFTRAPVTAALPGLSVSVPAPSTFALANSYGLNLGTNPAGPWIIASTVASAASDLSGGALYVAKTTSYGTPALSTGEAPAITGANIISEGTWGNQAGVVGLVFNANTQHSQPGSTASAVALYGEGICGIAACSATWGGVIAAYDTSAQTNPTNSLYGLEVDNYANGTDTHLSRIGIQIVAGRPTGAGTANTVGHGILFTGTGADGLFVNMIDGGTSTATNAISIAGMTITNAAISAPGFTVFPAGDTIARTLTTSQFTVATLPTCNAGSNGLIAIVTDLAVAPTYNAAIGAGGGANQTITFCRNSAWTSH